MAESNPSAFDWNNGPLAEGLRCYRAGEFWEAHEHWESVWLGLGEPEKSFLQALIQVAAAFHHWQAANRRGTISLLGRALVRLAASGPEFGGLNVLKLREESQRWLAALKSEAQVPSAFPAFQIIAPSA